jgi:hypothetical protein
MSEQIENLMEDFLACVEALATKPEIMKQASISGKQTPLSIRRPFKSSMVI